MNFGSRRLILGAMGTTAVLLLGTVLAGGQAGAPEAKPLMAEEAFKNVQVLKGISVPEFMETMGFFAASLGANCTYCHVAESSGSWEKYADDNDHKQTARKMVLMMRGINQAYFGGRRVVTCYSCHRFGERPKVIPNLAEQYGAPPQDEPDDLQQAAGAPPVDQILDKYIQALGGAQRVASITSVVAKGTYTGYEGDKSPVEMYAKAPGQRTIIVHTNSGDSTTTFDGRNGWVAAPETQAPVPLVALSGADLDAAKVDAEMSFPAQVKQAFTNWRVGFPVTVDDRDLQVIQGTVGKVPVKLYFDPESGLLVRTVRFTETPVGRVPTQTDYADYRDVSGVKMPFRIAVTWTDGRSVTELADVQTNVPIDATKFAKPAPATKAEIGRASCRERV